MLESCPCTYDQLISEDFDKWREQIQEAKGNIHRKIWEWCYISQALHERGMLSDGKRGLGFAVGQEPLTSLFASYGCNITATDLAPKEMKMSNNNWIESGQHASSLEILNKRGLCESEKFRKNVSFQFVNMKKIPSSLKNYDFCWSACAMEHLGSIRLARNFIFNMLDCLKPGGVAVHTTEFNVSSNLISYNYTSSILLRKRDLLGLKKDLERRGHHIELDFTFGNSEKDSYVDKPPYKNNPHLKLLIRNCVTTSFGLIITKTKL